MPNLLPRSQPAVCATSAAHKSRLALAVSLLMAGAAQAQTLGVSTQGNTGGLSIPSADVLETGSAALSYGNYREPRLRPSQREESYSLGFGLAPNIELFGRFAEYTSPSSTSLFTGLRDLSVNLKAQLPMFWEGQPKIAIGLNDAAGGATNFQSAYVVVSDRLGPVRWSAGYARGKPIRGNAANGYAFDGAFGGAEFLVGDTGLSALAEYDGQQKHVGLRYASSSIQGLGGSKFVFSAQRAFGAAGVAGQSGDTNSYTLSMLVPLGREAGTPAAANQLAREHALPALDAQSAGAMKATREDRLDALQRALVQVGLESVRVGTQDQVLVVEYENHRYEHNEADALGLVLGLAAELAPVGVERVVAVTHKAGLALYETAVDLGAYRGFLRDGQAAPVRESMAVVNQTEPRRASVSWLDATPTRRTPVRLEIGPDVNYALGTEVGAFDYSVAANLQGVVPLWRGAELYTSYIQRMANSRNYGPGYIFNGSLHRTGLKVAALHQSFWLGQHVLANVGAGRYNYDAYGVQGEASIFVPGRDDLVRLRGGLYQRQPGQTSQQRVQASGSYRWVVSPQTWVEAGAQQFSDGTRGPSLEVTRWFGDVGVHVFYRKGGTQQFAGLEVSIPLTPRQGMAPGMVQVAGAQRFKTGLRTQITTNTVTGNYVAPDAVRDLKLSYNAEWRQLNAGRIGQNYYLSQLLRMREAFYLYGRAQLP